MFVRVTENNNGQVSTGAIFFEGQATDHDHIAAESVMMTEDGVQVIAQVVSPAGDIFYAVADAGQSIQVYH